MKARTAVGRGKGLLSGPGSDLPLSIGMEKEKEKCEDNKWIEEKKLN